MPKNNAEATVLPNGPAINAIDNIPSEDTKKTQPISAKIEKDLYKEVKVYTIRHDMRFNEVVERALRQFIGI